MATTRQPLRQLNTRSASTLTLADTYGLGLIAFDHDGADQTEIFAYLSPTAKKIYKSATKQSGTKKPASKRRVAMKR